MIRLKSFSYEQQTSSKKYWFTFVGNNIMDLSQSYKQRPEIDDHYDAICIGSGLGCLTTANLMAKRGKKVLVLEKHYTPGGFTHVFSRPEYEWDVGVHYVGEVLKPGTMMYNLFQHLSNGEMKWADMGDVYDRIVFGNTTYDFVKGVGNFKEKMKSYFPNETKGIDKYVKELFAVNSATRTYFAEKILPETIRFFTSGLLRKSYLKYSNRTTKEVIGQCTNDPKLLAVLTGQYGDYGLPPSKSSFVMHAAVAKHYMGNGGAYPVGGSINFFKTIAPEILNAGGKAITNADVINVLVKNGTAIGVKMKDGREILSDTVISGAGLDVTLNKLLPKEELSKFPLEELKSVPHSVGHVSLYIGIKETSESLNLPKANFWIYPDNYDHDENVENYLKDPENTEFPVVYISFPSAKDPEFETRFPGKSTIEIITLAPYEWFTQWENSRWKKRGQEYDDYKEKMSLKLLDKLYERLPQLKGKIDYYELSTPLSTKHFANYEHGELYGLDHIPERYRIKALRPKTPIKNFYLTGQDILSAGIGGAGMAGVLTASSVLNKNIIFDLMKQR